MSEAKYPGNPGKNIATTQVILETSPSNNEEDVEPKLTFTPRINSLLRFTFNKIWIDILDTILLGSNFGRHLMMIFKVTRLNEISSEGIK